ncbi:hypothetical protein ACIQYZ_28880 [Rhodococcus erythropolis]
MHLSSDKKRQIEFRQPSGTPAQRWQRYLAWNAAVAEVIYPETDEAVPAYMDLEQDLIDKIAAAAEEGTASSRAALVEVVRGATIDRDGAFSLSKIALQTRRLPGRSIEEPPCLAFLAVTVIAAEEMGNTEEGLAPHAYYARLARILGLDDDDSALRKEYRQYAELLWKRVNKWLENLEGERGIPTAFALTHRYVGLPMAQALVREADRRRFGLMFTQYGLSPGMRLAPEDLIPYLGMWLTSASSAPSGNLRRLWKRTDSHDRIATIAAVELANWDGGQQDSHSSVTTGRTILIANMRTGFIGSSLDLSLAVRPIGELMDGHMEVLETAGRWSAIGFIPGTAGLWRTSYTEEIDFGSILDGLVRIRHAEANEGPEYKRHPRRIVPLIYDDLQSAYVQAERLQLGADSLLLVRTTGTTAAASGAVEEVQRVLSYCARPGFTTATSIEGLPDGWTLFSNVQLFTAPVATKFNELVPLARNQLTVAGGLQIPSRIRKWSTVSPPEIRATVQSEKELRVTLADVETEVPIESWESSSGSLVAPLSDLDLQDGDYQISLFTGSNTNPTQQISVRLRSGAAIDEITWNRAPRLTYNLDSPLGALSASEEMASHIVVDGLVCDGDAGVPATEPATSKIFWSKPRTLSQPHRVSIGTPDPKSCVVTGAHHISLPTWYGGHAPKVIEGECSSCGLVKRFPGWLPSRRQKGIPANAREAGDDLVSVTALPVVAKAKFNWDAALDTLIHLGGGPFSSLDRVARQLEGSALFVDTFTRTLEALGHIAIERDHRGRPTRWELSPSCLAQVASGQYRLTGGWSRPTISTVRSQFGSEVLKQIAQETGPSENLVSPLTTEQLEIIANLEDATIVSASGAELLRALPRLSEVGAAIERVTVPGFESAERFDLASATWMSTGDIANPGAYRIKRGFEILYIFRDENDINDGLAAITSVHLAKHLAANLIGKTFAFYIEKSEALLTPRGCELPGLYDRAAVAFTGHLPSLKSVAIAQEKRKCLMYSSIDKANADLLTTLLTT